MTTIIPTSAPLGSNNPRVDFKKDQFEGLIWQKGYDVIHESALVCPCVSKAVNQQSSCKNCGGTKWIYINPTQSRMVLHSMNMSTKFKQWSQENLGTASLTSLSDDEISYMDRITVLDGNSIFSEVLFLKEYNGTYYFNTIYNIKEIKYIGVFINTGVKLTPLIYGTDFTYVDNKIIFLTAANYTDINADELDCSITIRYVHAPQFHVLDIPRETIQSFVNINGKEVAIDLPIHAVCRRSHYVLDAQNFEKTRILDNSVTLTFDQINPPSIKC